MRLENLNSIKEMQSKYESSVKNLQAKVSELNE